MIGEVLLDLTGSQTRRPKVKKAYVASGEKKRSEEGSADMNTSRPPIMLACPPIMLTCPPIHKNPLSVELVS